MRAQYNGHENEVRTCDEELMQRYGFEPIPQPGEKTGWLGKGWVCLGMLPFVLCGGGEVLM